MSSMMKPIYKRLNLYMRKMGFEKRGRCFYKIQQDVAFCFCCDYPGGLVYSHFFIMPLYMPCQFRYLTYGNRLDIKYHSVLPTLTAESGDDEVEKWFEVLTKLLENDIFLFYEQISSPEKLLEYVSEEREVWSGYFACTNIHMLKLRIYTCLYLKDYHRVKQLIDEYRAELDVDTCFTERLKREWRDEMAEIEEMIQKGVENVEGYCLRICEETRTNWF